MNGVRFLYLANVYSILECRRLFIAILKEHQSTRNHHLSYSCELRKIQPNKKACNGHIFLMVPLCVMHLVCWKDGYEYCILIGNIKFDGSNYRVGKKILLSFRVLFTSILIPILNFPIRRRVK